MGKKRPSSEGGLLDMGAKNRKWEKQEENVIGEEEEGAICI